MRSGFEPVNSRPRLWAAVAVVVSLFVACGAVANASPERLGIGLVVAAAMLWATLPVAASLLRPGSARRRSAVGGESEGPTPGDPDAADAHVSSLGIIVRIGNEPLEVARATVLLNKASGLPIVLSSATPLDPALQRLGVEAVVEPNAVAAIERCARRLGTDVVMLVSGRAVFDIAALDAIREEFAWGADWVIGDVEPLSRDEVLCDPGQQVGLALRRSARAGGAALWENDGVALRCSTILHLSTHRHAPSAGHPVRNSQRAAKGQTLGRWLRRLQACGFEGATVPLRVAWRSLPADPGSYWPDSVARHRMRLRDALGAASHGSLSSRCIALGIAAYELSIVPALLWIAAPIWVGAGGVFPFDIAPAAATAAVIGAALLRWIGLRRATGVPLRPRADLTAAAYRLPASFSSVVGRGRPRSDRTSTSPLTVGALVCTVLTGWAIVSLPAAQRPTVTVTVTATMLAMLWYVAVLGLSQSNWARTAFRLPLRLEATIEGIPTTVLNGSPGGLAVRPAPTIGDRPIAVSIRLDDGSELPCTATVVARRGAGPEASAGLRLSLTDQGRERWMSQLHGTLAGRNANATALAETAPGPGDPHGDEHDHAQLHVTARGVAERVVSLVVSVVAMATVLVLIAVVGGVQMSVIRSQSMVPTYGVGDVVFSRQIAASDLAVGDVAQIPSEMAAIDQGETLTHRVVSVSDRGDDTVVVETRGDNNDLSEQTRLYREQSVGRVWAAVPALGRPLLWVRQQWAAVAFATAAIGIVGLFARRRRHRTTPM